MKRVASLLVFLAVAATAGGAAGAKRDLVTGSWTGTYNLHGPGTLTFTLRGNRAVVALGVGHAEAQEIAVMRRGARIRFQLPGRPTPLRFDGRLRGSVIQGTAAQGSARGTFSARRGQAPQLIARGMFAAGDRTLAVVDDPYGPARLVDTDSGEVHALYEAGEAFRIGSGFATSDPIRGTAVFGAATATIAGARASRRPMRQLEVRFASGGAVLSGTLTLPAGAGPHPAAAFVHGSGPTMRAYLPDLQTIFVRHGVAVLAYDKRGIGQSGGAYPGESPTDTAIDILARDAEAAVRFLAAQPEIDRARAGLAGHSQAGWIMPLAASRENAVRFIVVFSGPAVTADENEAYQSLTGQGETPQRLSEDEVDAEVTRRGPGGVDPIPWIRSLRIPGLWLYGGLDQHIPPRLSVRRLEPLARDGSHDFTIAVFLNGNHALVETTTGLTSEMLRSDRFAPGLFPRVAEWLRLHGLADR